LQADLLREFFAREQSFFLTGGDLVVDRAPSIVPEKRRIGSIRVDPLREIAANKICTLLGRTEAKDLLDIQALIQHGIDLRQAVNDAHQKDGGVSAATLAFLMEDHRAWSAAIAAGELADALAALRSDLARQFRAIAFEQARK